MQESIVVLLLVVAVLACGVPALGQTPETNKATVQRVLEEAWNQGQLAVVDEAVAPGYVYHEPALGDIPGPAGLKQTILGYRMALSRSALHDRRPDRPKRPGRDALDGGRHPPRRVDGYPRDGTDDHDDWDQHHPLRRRRMIVEEWSTWDVLGLMQQLGVVPADHDQYVWGESSVSQAMAVIRRATS